MLVPSHVWSNTHVVCVSREPVAAQKDWDCSSTNATRCCVRLVPVDDTSHVAFLVNEDALEIKIIMVEGEQLRLRRVERRL